MKKLDNFKVKIYENGVFTIMYRMHGINQQDAEEKAIQFHQERNKVNNPVTTVAEYFPKVA